MFHPPADRCAVMGILNVTPDSFSDGGQYMSRERAVMHAEQMLESGADLLDVGGESTRPGATPVDLEEESSRILPVIQALAIRGCPLSIDTTKPELARRAILEGACFVNDVSGGSEEMFQVITSSDVSYAIMHAQGTPQTMQINPNYCDVCQEVFGMLLRRVQELGLPKNRVWVDPGIGFGKTTEHNLELLRNLEQLTGHPVLVGVSRKAMIGRILRSEENPLPVAERGAGTLALEVVAMMKGARMVRTHDVRPTAQASRVLGRLLESSSGF